VLLSSSTLVSSNSILDERDAMSVVLFIALALSVTKALLMCSSESPMHCVSGIGMPDSVIEATYRRTKKIQELLLSR
jgi:hypothetical protein